jgi:hypothetical protein
MPAVYNMGATIEGQAGATAEVASSCDLAQSVAIMMITHVY